MKNRWLIALAAVGIHISIGSVYAWSVLCVERADAPHYATAWLYPAANNMDFFHRHFVFGLIRRLFGRLC